MYQVLVSGSVVKKQQTQKKDQQKNPKPGEFYFALVIDVGGWEERIEVEGDQYSQVVEGSNVKVVLGKKIVTFNNIPRFQNVVTKFDAGKAA